MAPARTRSTAEPHRAADGRPPCSVRIGGYRKGRQRLASADGQRAHAQDGPPAEPEGARAVAVTRPRGQPGGRPQAVDARHPRQRRCLSPAQHTGSWGSSPQARPVRVIYLAAGAALHAAIGPHRGKGRAITPTKGPPLPVTAGMGRRGLGLIRAGRRRPGSMRAESQARNQASGFASLIDAHRKKDHSAVGVPPVGAEGALPSASAGPE